jgi:hypothetical protein
VGDEKAGSVTAGSAFERSPVLSRSGSGSRSDFTPASGAEGGLKKKGSMVAEMKRRMREDKCDNPSCKNMEEDGRKFEFKCNKCARVKYCSKV